MIRSSPPHEIFSHAVAVAISGYQRHLSPLKGYACAHRVLHGGDSCSQYVKALILEKGPAGAVARVRERFAACRAANESLRAGISSRETSRRRWPWTRFRRRRHRGGHAEDLLDAGEESGGGCGLLGCEPESVDCDFFDCGFDCSP